MEYKELFDDYQAKAKKVILWNAVTFVTALLGFLSLLRMAWLLSQPSFGGVQLGMMPYVFVMCGLLVIPSFVFWIKNSLQLKKDKGVLNEKLKDALAEAKESGNTRSEIEIEEMRRKLEKGLLAVAQ